MALCRVGMYHIRIIISIVLFSIFIIPTYGQDVNPDGLLFPQFVGLEYRDISPRAEYLYSLSEDRVEIKDQVLLIAIIILVIGTGAFFTFDLVRKWTKGEV